MKTNLAIITTHPIQYQIPLFKELSKLRKLKSHVFYAIDLGVNKKKINKDFNLNFSWNIRMLSGYKFFFSKNKKSSKNNNLNNYVSNKYKYKGTLDEFNDYCTKNNLKI